MGIRTWLARIFRDRKSGYSGDMGLDQVHSRLGLIARDNLVPGLSIAVSYKGEQYFEAGYGYADIYKKRLVAPGDTLFRAASASKPIAATALLMMVEQGEISLDRSFYEYVPYFPKKKFDFTVRQLAAHTAGIRSYRGKEFALNRPMTIAESIAFFKDDPLLFKPGTSYHYNSLDWVLVSLAMEEISGIPFEDYVRLHVLNPLGMEKTMAEIPLSLPRDCATFYTKGTMGLRKAVSVDNRYKLAGGGYLTTVRDLNILGQAYLQGIIPDTDHRKEFLSPVYVNGQSTYYGLGWEVSTDPFGREYYGHVGNGVGGYSNFFVYPREEVVISTLINCTDPKIQDALNIIYNEIFNTLPGKTIS